MVTTVTFYFHSILFPIFFYHVYVCISLMSLYHDTVKKKKPIIFNVSRLFNLAFALNMKQSSCLNLVFCIWVWFRMLEQIPSVSFFSSSVFESEGQSPVMLITMLHANKKIYVLLWICIVWKEHWETVKTEMVN